MNDEQAASHNPVVTGRRAGVDGRGGGNVVAPEAPRGVVHHVDLIQGGDEWLQARCGMLTASEMKLILTPTLKEAGNDKARAHVWEMASQRISNFVEVRYIGDDMLRGWGDEASAKALYTERYAPVEDMGFITNDRWGFPIGFSPDGLVGGDGFIECKSRRQRFQVETIVGNVCPFEHRLQIQTGYLVSGRKWCDYVSYSAGLPMAVIAVPPDHEMQEAIVEAATKFERQVAGRVEQYRERLRSDMRLVPTERTIEKEMFV